MSKHLSQASRAVAELLEQEVQRMRARGIPVGEDDLRGLYVSDAEADRILASPADEDGGRQEPTSVVEALGERMCQLAQLLGLTAEESAAVAFLHVVESNPELERLVSYVQDDVSKKRPRLELLVRLLWADIGSGLAAFDIDRALRRHLLVSLHEEPSQPVTPLLARSVALDARISRFLGGGEAVDEAIATVATLRPAAEDPAPPAIDVAALEPAHLGLRGTDTSLIRRVAAGLAASRGLAWTLELRLETGGELTVLEASRRATREAALSGAALLVTGLDGLEQRERDAALAAVRSGPAPLLLVAFENDSTWTGASIAVERPGAEARLAEWQAALVGSELAAEAGDALPALAAKFELDTGAIADAAATASGLARAREPGKPVITVDDLYAAARMRSAPILSTLATKITVRKAWDDLILEPDPLAQLRELCAMVEHKHLVYDEWGFGEKLANGKGAVALFAGQSGTGKTMAAGIIAGELGLDLYRIDLSGVVSKYIGETEKNLSSIFRDASLSNSILFFDEADALFGKRSEVRDSHDRYANIETAYLLQQIEEYSGPVILSTNLKMNLDEAFLRRLHFVIDFPMPEEPYRLRIWKSTIPPAVPLAEDVDFAFLARQFRISGGNIRNIVLAAAFLAARDGGPLAMSHLIKATRREFQKLGRMVTEADFGEYLPLLA